jgi:hypothetical protein
VALSSGVCPLTVVASLLIVPVYDTLRVFVVRVRNRKSPFLADNNHIHHLLLRMRLSHMQATGLLLAFNIVPVGFAFLAGELPAALQLLIVLLLVMAMNSIVIIRLARQERVRAIQDAAVLPEVTGVTTVTVVPAISAMRKKEDVYAGDKRVGMALEVE